MSNLVRQIVLFAVLLLTLGMVNWGIAQKERTMQSGRIMLLELAPLDPRSLMQGDYMVLRYKAANAAADGDIAREGNLVMAVDANNVATFKRIQRPGEVLAPGEHLLRYRRRSHGIRLGAESFFFQEGRAGDYRTARYGELRVTESGDSVLTGLRNANFERLGPDEIRQEREDADERR